MRRIERVMLIYPPVSFSPQAMKQCNLPLGLAYIAAVIGDEVELLVLDAAAEGWEHEEKAGGNLLKYGLPICEIESKIKKFKPDLVGMSCIFSSQFRNVADVARAAKRTDPSIITITGGSHPTFMPQASLHKCPELDLIAQGEGEFILLDVIRASREGGELGGIPGLVWRDDGEVVLNKTREPYPDPDKIPFPARDLFPLERYSRIGMPMGTVFKRRPYMNMITSRGCPYHCTFCSSTMFWGNCYRKRSPENVLAEMEHLYHNLGVREFKFFDDNLTVDRKRAQAIFQGMIDRGINVTWNMPNGVHVATLDEEMLGLMKKSGCFELTLAVESGDEDVLRDIIKKPSNLGQIQKAAQLTRKMGIATNAFLIIGFPGETKEQIQRTLDFSKKLDLDRADFFMFSPLPGTALYEECIKKGYLDPGESAEDMDYFVARFDTPEWTREELHRLRRNWFWKYNAGLLVRHPIGFFKNYMAFLARPKQAWEVIRRVVRH